MKTVDERIENLSDEMLNLFVEGVAHINCGGFDKLSCNDCPLQIDGACLCVKLYDEKEHRKAKARTNYEETVAASTSEKTVATSTTELESKAQELVKQLDLLVELLSKF